MSNSYLLDTHVFIWWINNSQELSEVARDIIRNPKNVILVSSIVSWEISIKAALGRLTAVGDPEVSIPFHIKRNKFEELQFSIRDSLAIFNLENHHHDPFDRALIAQARLLALPIITRDRIFNSYKIEAIW